MSKTVDEILAPLDQKLAENRALIAELGKIGSWSLEPPAPAAPSPSDAVASPAVESGEQSRGQ